MVTGVNRTSIGGIALVVGAAALITVLVTLALKFPAPIRGPLLVIGDQHGFSFADANASGARLVRDEGPYFQPRWSPDGAFVAVTLLHPQDANHLYILRPDGSIAAEAAGVVDFAWAPVGQALAVLGIDDRDFKVIDPMTGLPSSIEKPDGLPLIHSFAWSPDATRLVIAAHGAGPGARSSLWITPRFGGRPVRFSGESPLSLPAWSPDGRWIAAAAPICAFEACPSDIRIYDVESGTRRFDLQRLVGPGRPLWSADGNVLLVDRGLPLGDGTSGTQHDVIRFELDRGVTRLTTSPANDTLVGWDPGGATIVVMRQAFDGASSRTEFWRVAVDGSGEARLVADAYGVALQPLP